MLRKMYIYIKWAAWPEQISSVRNTPSSIVWLKTFCMVWSMLVVCGSLQAEFMETKHSVHSYRYTGFAKTMMKIHGASLYHRGINGWTRSEIVWGYIKICLRFQSFSTWKWGGDSEFFLMWNKCPLVRQIQWHGYWWSGARKHSQTTPSAPSHPLRHPRSGVGPTHLWLLAD